MTMIEAEYPEFEAVVIAALGLLKAAEVAPIPLTSATAFWWVELENALKVFKG